VEFPLHVILISHCTNTGVRLESSETFCNVSIWHVVETEATANGFSCQTCVKNEYFGFKVGSLLSGGTCYVYFPYGRVICFMDELYRKGGGTRERETRRLSI
jgi:hypothetical protein